jgi:hypothetical protein
MVYYLIIRLVSMVRIHRHGWREERASQKIEEGRTTSQKHGREGGRGVGSSRTGTAALHRPGLGLIFRHRAFLTLARGPARPKTWPGIGTHNTCGGDESAFGSVIFMS